MTSLRSNWLTHGRKLAAASALLTLTAAGRLAAQSGPLFPQSFRVEHHLVQEDGDGSRFVGEAVVDTYGGSWIVSQRPDGSRLIVDLVKRELTEVRPEKGTYWTASFDRVAELESRLRIAQGLGRATSDAATADQRAASETTPSTPGAGAHKSASAADELVVSEVAEDRSKNAAALGASSASMSTALAARAGVRHLRVAPRNASSTGAALDVWVDPSVRLTSAALGALTAFESDVLSGPTHSAPASASKSAATLEPTRFLAAARAHAEGALPVRTSRPAAISPSGQPVGSVEDLATRLEPLDRFPTELAQIPEGLRRVPHPLEATVRFLEEEAVRNAAMSGAAPADRQP